MKQFVLIGTFHPGCIRGVIKNNHFNEASFQAMPPNTGAFCNFPCGPHLFCLMKWEFGWNPEMFSSCCIAVRRKRSSGKEYENTKNPKTCLAKLVTDNNLAETMFVLFAIYFHLILFSESMAFHFICADESQRYVPLKKSNIFKLIHFLGVFEDLKVMRLRFWRYCWAFLCRFKFLDSVQ